MANDSLLKDLNKKDEVEKSDPVFKKIESFSNSSDIEASLIFSEFANYKSASDEFARFALFTGSIWKKSTSMK